MPFEFIIRGWKHWGEYRNSSEKDNWGQQRWESVFLPLSLVKAVRQMTSVYQGTADLFHRLWGEGGVNETCGAPSEQSWPPLKMSIHTHFKHYFTEKNKVKTQWQKITIVISWAFTVFAVIFCLSWKCPIITQKSNFVHFLLREHQSIDRSKIHSSRCIPLLDWFSK